MTEINNIEKVKKIIEQDRRDQDSLGEFADTAEKLARQICQLFPQPLDDKELEREIYNLLATSRGTAFLTAQFLALLQQKTEEARGQERERLSCKDFLKLPVEERRKILAMQAKNLADNMADSQAKEDIKMMD